MNRQFYNVNQAKAMTDTAFKIKVDQQELDQYTEQQLEQVIGAYQTILDLCDGVFTAKQEMLLMDMKELFNEELIERYMEE